MWVTSFESKDVIVKAIKDKDNLMLMFTTIKVNGQFSQEPLLINTTLIYLNHHFNIKIQILIMTK
jgi:hypothetical protein